DARAPSSTSVLRARNSALAQLAHEQLQRASAMADAILFVGAELGCGDTAFGQFEDRVVSESARASRHIDDASFPARLTHDRRGVELPAHEGERTAIARGAPLERHVAYRIDQLE